jgi:hypothetical protein
MESFEEMVSLFEVENPMQQWYGDTSFNEFGFGYGEEAGPSYTHTPPFDSPPPANPQNDEDDEASREESEDDE